jgi:hypothetical protein
MLKVPWDQLEPHILRVGGTKLSRAASSSLMFGRVLASQEFLGVGHALSQICLPKQAHHHRRRPFSLDLKSPSPPREANIAQAR